MWNPSKSGSVVVFLVGVSGVSSTSYLFVSTNERTIPRQGASMLHGVSAINSWPTPISHTHNTNSMRISCWVERKGSGNTHQESLINFKIPRFTVFSQHQCRCIPNRHLDFAFCRPSIRLCVFSFDDSETANIARWTDVLQIMTGSNVFQILIFERDKRKSCGLTLSSRSISSLIFSRSFVHFSWIARMSQPTSSGRMVFLITAFACVSSSSSSNKSSILLGGDSAVDVNLDMNMYN